MDNRRIHDRHSYFESRILDNDSEAESDFRIKIKFKRRMDMEAKDLMYDWIVEQDFDFRYELVEVLFKEFRKTFQLDLVLDSLEIMDKEQLSQIIEYAEELRENLMEDDTVYDDGEMGLADIKLDDERMERLGL